MTGNFINELDVANELEAFHLVPVGQERGELYKVTLKELSDYVQKPTLASQVDGYGRDLMEVFLGHGFKDVQASQSLINEAIYETMYKIRIRHNNNGEIDFSGIPNYKGLLLGDYIDGLDLSGISVAPNGNAPQIWNDGYKNNRIVISGFNAYKNSGDTETIKNHILFTFRNVICQGQMKATDDNTGGYTATLMRTWLEGAAGDGNGVFANKLRAALGGATNYLYTIRKYHSKKNPTARAWENYTVWLPTEIEVFGTQYRGDEADPSYPSLNVHFPIYQKSTVFRCKRFNGARAWWWESTPRAASAASFCLVSYGGSSGSGSASSASGGIAPAFCVA